MAEIQALTGLVRRLGLDADQPMTSPVEPGRSRSDFVSSASRWRAAFAAAPGGRYALHHEDSFEFAAALFGAWHAGKIVYLPADALPSTLQSLSAQVDGFAGAFANGLQPDGMAASPADAAWDELDPENVRLVLYTSGSRGDPVAIGKCLRQLDSEIAGLESRFGERLADAHVHGTVSHQHIYGLLFRVLWPLAAARPFASRRIEYPEQIAALGAEPVVLVSSPAQLKRLPDGLDWSSTRSALRIVFSSGGPLPADARAAVVALWDQAVVEVFGSTETGGIASRSGASEHWRTLPGVEFSIEDTVLKVRSPHLPDDDWFCTEDRAQSVGDGFELLGRGDRLLKLEERRVSLDAIERVLRGDSLVGEAAVLPLAHARDRIGAVIVPSAQGRLLLRDAGRKALIDRLRATLRPHVDPIALPKLWRFVQALPVDAQGKTTVKRLAELFRAGPPQPRWQSQDSQSAKLEFVANEDLEVFDGHFPGTPILPGVAMIGWAIEWGRHAFAISTPFRRMEALKFQQLVRPGTRLQLELVWSADLSSLRFSFQSPQGVHASGKIVFAGQDAPA
jgi:acyl-coenzyme A synthetase/AMP-(fatty) acid ligase/3-hydroxymyristoyl/3-hydroxydecanoyl-(acyl carrier protein) dehydratase